jgi:glucose dehydrogenase
MTSRFRIRFVCVAFGLAALVGFAGACTKPDPPSARDTAPAALTASASTRTGDWVTYNGPLSGDRYSPLTQITAANVGQIGRYARSTRPKR